MTRKRRLVVGNWKMHPSTLREAKKIFTAVARRVRTTRNTQIVVCPPVLFLHELARGYRGTKVGFGAQDTSMQEKEGAYTGEISARMVKDLGAGYVIIGHSERRAVGETDEIVGEKMRVALKAGLVPILCIGEHERDREGAYLRWLEQQLTLSLSKVPRAHAKKIIVAYEPIWAIGKTAADAVTPHELHEMTIFIKKILTRLYGRKTGMNIRILYGGSVEATNIETLSAEESIDGFLVGHASLDPGAFTAIVSGA